MTKDKLTITLLSDLHLEYGYQKLSGGEVLILAGDIGEVRDFKKEYHSTKLLDRTPGDLKWYDFLYHECAKYDRVFYVMGNHEHYNGRYDKTYNELTSILPKNVRLLENEYEEYEGVLFLGATLWTDCNKNDPLTIDALKYSMNDYQIITNYYENTGLYHKLTPAYTAGVHRTSVNYLESVLKENTNTPTVVITHHAPTYKSINARFQDERIMNGGYASDLSELILDYPNIKYCFHGHMHDPVDYYVGSTRVLSNPRGYFGYQDTSHFNPNFTVEI